MRDQEYYNLVAGGLAIAVVFGLFLGIGLISNGSSAGPSAPTATPSSTPTNMYLTIQINPVDGMPQYSPANFTIPTGKVVFTIVDYDAPIAWGGCTCNVTGTVGGTEVINATSYAQVPSGNVAHTFTVPSLGLNVLIPGMSTVSFTLNVTQTGSFTWYCEDPCGSDGYTGVPMGAPGYMTGTVTVV